MKTLDWFSSNAVRLGFSITTVDLNSLLQQNSSAYEQNHSQSFCVSASLKRFKLLKSPVLDGSHEFYLSSETSLDDVLDIANLQNVELFDINDSGFVQVEPIALDPANSTYQLLNDLADGETLYFKGSVVEESSVYGDLAFAKDMQNPITSYKKGPIEVKTRSLMETLMLQEQLAARSGANLQEISVTRYSTGLNKGQRDDI